MTNNESEILNLNIKKIIWDVNPKKFFCHCGNDYTNDGIEITLADVLLAVRSKCKESYIKWDENFLYIHSGRDSVEFAAWDLFENFNKQEASMINFLELILLY